MKVKVDGAPPRIHLTRLLKQTFRVRVLFPMLWQRRKRLLIRQWVSLQPARNVAWVPRFAAHGSLAVEVSHGGF